MTSKFSDLEKVCKALGLKCKEARKGNTRLWKGFINNEPVTIAIHLHQAGKDIPNGLFREYVKELGFASSNEYFNFLKSL